MIPEPVQRIAQTNGINLPAPVRFLHVRVGNQTFRLVVVQLWVVCRGLRCERHIVAKADVIDTPLGQRLTVFLGDIKIKATPGKVVEKMLRVFAAHMDIGKPVTPVHGVHRHHHIVRRTGQWIDRTHGNHAPYLQCRVNLTRSLYRQRACHQFIVRRLVHNRLAVFTGLVFQARVSKRREVFVIICLVVNFIKRHPVLHFVLVTGKNHCGKTDKEIDKFAVTPAAIFRHQMVWHLEMRQRNHRFNAIFQAFVKQVIIELQASLIGLRFVA